MASHSRSYKVNNETVFMERYSHLAAYAKKGINLVHISEVARGLKCDCVCVACGAQLIAKKGQQRIEHFAHAADTDCFGSAETALHLLAKELFKELNSIALPQYKFKKEKIIKHSYTLVQHEKIVAKGGDAIISKVSIEQSEGRFIPDVTLESNAKKLLVEIAVTHKVDRIKLRHIRRKDFPTIEIQLDLADAALSRDALRNKLKNDIDSKRWLYHPEQKKEERTFVDKVRAAMRSTRRTAIKTKQVALTLPHISANKREKEGLSNAQMDRMLYEFFLRFKRQATEEEATKLRLILYGNRVVKKICESTPTYESIKNGESKILKP